MEEKEAKGKSTGGQVELQNQQTGTREMIDLPGGSAVNNPPAIAGDVGSIPGSGRSPGEGSSNPCQYSYLGNPMDREAWLATVQGVAKSRTQLSDSSNLVTTREIKLMDGSRKNTWKRQARKTTQRRKCFGIREVDCVTCTYN